MAGGGGFGNNTNPNKIKGGRWTVAKFFSISVTVLLHDNAVLKSNKQKHAIVVLQLAFTMVWMTIISQLGYYKLLYGPQVLLQMNIAYFLPSIPLLGLSSQFDERLDQKFGMASQLLTPDIHLGATLREHQCLCRRG